MSRGRTTRVVQCCQSFSGISLQVQAAKDALTVDQYYQLENQSENKILKVRGPAANFARNLLDQVRAGIQIFNFGEITIQRELITFGVIVGFLLSSVGHAEEKKLFPFTVGYASVSGGRTPLWIAKDRGIFEKYGLDV